MNMEIENCAAVWFARLERAINIGDERGEKLARENLARLGVEVHFEDRSEAKK